MRLIANYFRVGFYGARMKEYDGKEYVYRTGPKENLMTIQQRLKDAALSAAKSADDIEVLGNKAIDRSQFEKNKIYIQIAAVHPYYDPDEQNRKTAFERNFGISLFPLFSLLFFSNSKAKKTHKRKHSQEN